MIPFTTDEFLGVFAHYNLTVWPAQVLLYGVAVCAIGLAIQQRFDASGAISVILAALWLWSGVVYHLIFFSTVNKPAYLFAALFIAQSISVMYMGVWRRELRFRFSGNLSGLVGGGLVLYALVIYPTLNYQFEHMYPNMPTFGVPCPTTIFTFGILTWADGGLRPSMLIIPVGWSLLGFSAALSLGMVEDFGLVAAALLVSLLSFWKLQRESSKRRAPRHVPPD